LRTGTGTDLELNQTLNIQIEGYLRRNLRVTGVLSDRSRPEVGGISSSLGEIDKITLELSSDRFVGRVGDLDFERGLGRSASFKKALLGGSAAVNTGQVGADAVAGGIKSKNGSLKTFGRDGVSGPYRLLPNVGQSSVSILPGTERVWLDGRRLDRGVDADYQIDYLQGEVTFSPRIIVTSRSRIEIDFEYLDESYRQDFYAGRLSYGDTSSALFTEIGFISQTDSKDSPSRFDLLAEDIAALVDAGDSTQRAVRSGVTKVDSGKGSYSRRLLGSDTVFVYEGANQGDYRVEFSYFGEGDGDYRYVGGGVYEYVSPGGGSYLPLRRLPMPRRSDAISLSAQIAGAAASLRFDGILSNSDRNLFSDSDDGDNLGSDLTCGILFSPMKAADESDIAWNVGIRAHRSEREFSLPGRAYSVERGRVWGLTSDSVFNLAEEFTASQELSIGQAGTIQANWGTYRDRDFFDAERYGCAALLRPLTSISLRASRDDRMSTELTTDRRYRLYENTLRAGWDHSRLSVSLGWNDETDLRLIDTSSSGGNLDRYDIDVDLAGLSTGFSYETRDILRAGWISEYDSRNITFGYSGHGGFGRSQADIHVVHRRVHRFFPEQQDQTQLGASVDYHVGSRRSLFDLSLSYRVTREGIDRTSESFIKLAEGEGDYRLEDGVYVLDPLGEYIRVVEVLDAADVGIDLTRGLKLRTDLANWRACPDRLVFLKRVRLETHVRTSEQGDADEPFSAAWIAPYANVFDRRRFSLENTLRQTVGIGLSDRLSVFLSFDEGSRENARQNPPSADYRLTMLGRVEMNASSRVTMFGQYRFKRFDQDSRSFGDASFVEHHVRGSLTYELGGGFALTGEPGYLVDKSRRDDLRVNVWEGTLAVNRRLPGNGRINSKISYQHVTSSRSDLFIPFQYAGGRRVGENFQWGASVELRLSNNISARFSYDGEKTPQLQTRHVSSVSMKARF
jgi:hypothetical protein